MTDANGPFAGADYEANHTDRTAWSFVDPMPNGFEDDCRVEPCDTCGKLTLGNLKFDNTWWCQADYDEFRAAHPNKWRQIVIESCGSYGRPAFNA